VPDLDGKEVMYQRAIGAVTPIIERARHMYAVALVELGHAQRLRGKARLNVACATLREVSGARRRKPSLRLVTLTVSFYLCPKHHTKEGAAHLLSPLSRLWSLLSVLPSLSPFLCLSLSFSPLSRCVSISRTSR
jgi:hypothetical protein